MEIIADLHLHSKYSRAVSQKMVVAEIARWAKTKGIGLVGAPDWTHPLWFRQLKEELVEVAEGIFAHREDPEGPRFLLAVEIESNYSQGGRGRRIHNLVLSPSLEVSEKINNSLRTRGINLLSDGRPKTGLSSTQLCELVFSVSQKCLIIPCHVWTPWYSLYGSRSGFDSVKECFGEFSDQIVAIETGLSSDPAMNWRVGDLDSRSIVSFSDAHSGTKLGREATVLELESLSFPNVISAFRLVSKIEEPDRSAANFSLMRARKEATQPFAKGWGSVPIRSKLPPRDPDVSLNKTNSAKNCIAYTIEFYPEEGKYHYTGHRACNVKQTPAETKKLGETCPVCGRQLTVGVMHRVEKLATRRVDELEIKEEIIGEQVRGMGIPGRPPYVMMVTLAEILSESLNSGVSSQTVENEYNRLITALGSEFTVLLKTPIDELVRTAGERVAEGIRKVREKEIVIDPGFDGVFGKVKIWPSTEDDSETGQNQMSLF